MPAPTTLSRISWWGSNLTTSKLLWGGQGPLHPGREAGGKHPHLLGGQIFLSCRQPPAWSIWQPQTCPQGCRLPASYQTWGVQGGDPSKGRTVSSLQLPSNTPYLQDHPPPSIPEGSAPLLRLFWSSDFFLCCSSLSSNRSMWGQVGVFFNPQFSPAPPYSFAANF